MNAIIWILIGACVFAAFMFRVACRWYQIQEGPDDEIDLR